MEEEPAGIAEKFLPGGDLSVVLTGFDRSHDASSDVLFREVGKGPAPSCERPRGHRNKVCDRSPTPLRE